MNIKTGGRRGLRRAAAPAVAAAVAVLATACGSSSPPSAGASAPHYGQVLALARCMRSHGEPDFPDPSPSGGYTLTSGGLIKGSGGSPVDMNSSQAQAAYNHCRHVLPGAPSISRLEQELQQEQQKQAKALPELLKWEDCIRSHGEPDFNLPLGSQSPAPGNKSAVNPDSAQFQAALSACHHLLPPGDTIHISAPPSAAAPSTPAS